MVAFSAPVVKILKTERCMRICGCIGVRRLLSGPKYLRMHFASHSFSIISTKSMAEIQIVLRVSHGVLENMTDHGARGAFSGWCDI